MLKLFHKPLENTEKNLVKANPNYIDSKIVGNTTIIQ